MRCSSIVETIFHSVMMFHLCLNIKNGMFPVEVRALEIPTVKKNSKLLIER